jgi:hypothetical protein
MGGSSIGGGQQIAERTDPEYSRETTHETALRIILSTRLLCSNSVEHYNMILKREMWSFGS